MNVGRFLRRMIRPTTTRTITATAPITGISRFMLEVSCVFGVLADVGSGDGEVVIVGCCVGFGVCVTEGRGLVV